MRPPKFFPERGRKHVRHLILEKVREAEELAAHSKEGSATKEGWTSVANSWRLLAERLLSEPAPEDDSTILILH